MRHEPFIFSKLITFCKKTLNRFVQRWQERLTGSLGHTNRGKKLGLVLKIERKSAKGS
jgi:hypothetical protein